jgi:glycosyltransferase involved in cell wall biosynthesis
MKKSRGVLFFKTKLETLNLFTQELEKGFRNCGIDTMWIDVSENLASLGKLLEYTECYEHLAAIDFNSAVFGFQTPGGANVFDALNVYCINILVDHPYWYHEQLLRMPQNGAVICVDRNHMQYVSRFYPNIQTVAFMPHGGRRVHASGTKTIDVLYAGSLYRNLADAQHKPLDRWPFDAEGICEKSIAYLMQHTGVTIEAALEKQLLEEGIVLQDETLRMFVSDCVFIERIVSSYYRELAVGSLARAGIRLQLYGEGWESCAWVKLPNVSYGGWISPNEILHRMGKAKIVLNTMPWFKDGSHERIYNAMLNGAVVVSERNGFLDETLPRDAWAGYRLTESEIKELPQRVKGLLQDEALLGKMREAAYGYAEKSATWISRGEEICRELLNW